MTNLKGTEKQVNYANDIKEDMLNILNNLEKYVEEDKQKKFNKRINKTIAAIEDIGSAEEIINNFKSVLFIKEELGKALKISEIFAKQDKLSQAVFTNSIDQKYFDEYYTI